MFFDEFFDIYLYIFLCFLISIVLFILSYNMGEKVIDKEKISAYECGFSPVGDARQKFDIKFYLVAILFIVFDLEIIYLFPWAVSLSKIGFFGFFTMYFFIIILIVGFIYEWVEGALDW